VASAIEIAPNAEVGREGFACMKAVLNDAGGCSFGRRHNRPIAVAVSSNECRLLTRVVGVGVVWSASISPGHRHPAVIQIRQSITVGTRIVALMKDGFNGVQLPGCGSGFRVAFH
jgi:hypothetical protein